MILACMPLLCTSYIMCTHYPTPTNLNACVATETCAWCPQENVCVDSCYATCRNVSFGKGCKEQLREDYILNIVAPCVMGAILLAVVITVVAICIWKPEIRQACNTMRDEEAPLYVEHESL